jgi:diguanylate cyclase (GGDEF)-like protein
VAQSRGGPALHRAFPDARDDRIVDLMPIDTDLFRPRHWRWTAGAFCAIVAVGIADYLTEPAITFSLFYLVPVATAAWFGGMAVALCASTFAAILWLWAEYASSRLDSNVFVYAWNFCARGLFLLLVALLLARLRQVLWRERGLSRTDALTGLLNARAFREIVDAEIARARRYTAPMSLAFIDVDDFKRVNDSRGHGAGDLLLKRIAECIRENLRGSDVVARYGGDEFVVLLPAADEKAARSAIEKLRARCGDSLRAQDGPVTLSIGVVICRPGAAQASVDALLETADRLMYAVKSSGKHGARYEVCG